MVIRSKEEFVYDLVREVYPNKYFFFAEMPYAKENGLEGWSRLTDILANAAYCEARRRFVIDGKHYRESIYEDITEIMCREAAQRFVDNLRDWIKRMDDYDRLQNSASTDS